MHNHDSTNINSMAISATLHCLAGCAIGEVLGMVIGTSLGFSNGLTIALAVALAFVFGFGLSSVPLLRAGIRFREALSLVAAADTLSILTMEIVDNLVMMLVPGAIHASIFEPLFWISMAFALTAAFFAAVPVNRYLLTKNKGHAITMNRLHGHKEEHV